jgi:hypothetical protein
LKKARPTTTAKRCYSHLGGKLGERLFARMTALGWFEPGDGPRAPYSITAKGRRELQRLGVELD